jgi:hypothetical protein
LFDDLTHAFSTGLFGKGPSSTQIYFTSPKMGKHAYFMGDLVTKKESFKTFTTDILSGLLQHDEAW